MITRRKIGLFGGSFNPPTTAHLALARHAHDALQLDELWWLVAPHNPDKPKHTLAPFADRLAMASLAAAGETWLHVSDWEERLGTQQTADTLKGIRAAHPDIDFVWLMGTDNLVHFHQWNDWHTIPAAVPVAVFARPGDVDTALASPAAQAMVDRVSNDRAAALQPGQWILFGNEQMPISATAVRSAIGRGEDSPHILPNVADYICKRHLYRDQPVK